MVEAVREVLDEEVVVEVGGRRVWRWCWWAVVGLWGMVVVVVVVEAEEGRLVLSFGCAEVEAEVEDIFDKRGGGL